MPAEFNTADVMDWRIEHFRSLLTPSSATERKAIANAVIAEAKAKAALDGVVLVDDAAATFNTRLASIRDRIDTIAAEVAEAVSRERDPRKCETIIRHAVNDIRRQIVEANERKHR
jgi:hypothetical protein